MPISFPTTLADSQGRPLQGNVAPGSGLGVDGDEAAEVGSDNMSLVSSVNPVKVQQTLYTDFDPNIETKKA